MGENSYQGLVGCDTM